MCGIAGILALEGAVDPGSVTRMAERLKHRGPDDFGLWLSRRGNLALGHRRLAILDLSPAGHQPMTAADGRYCACYNGEIYNFRDLRSDLERAGATFRSESDTEVLLQGYAVHGPNVVDRLVGMFAFAIWDDERQALFLARDRAGEKPLYYATDPHRFAFASEYQALEGLGFDASIDPDALALYLRYQSVPAPFSITRGIRKLPAGHAMTIDTQGAVRTWRYWDPVAAARKRRSPMTAPEALAEVERLVDRAVARQMVSDVPLGAFLSGGIDSSVVVSSMVRAASGPVKTFTIGFEVDGFDESPHAAAVAKHLGTDHTTEYLTEKDALDLVVRLPEIYGEPFADSSALPTYLVSRTARRVVTVSLSGDGGDEAFGGYDRYTWLERLRVAAALTGPVAPLVKPIARRLPGRLGRLERVVGKSAMDVARFFAGPFSDEEVGALTGRAPRLSEYERAWQTLRLPSVRQHAMLADLLTYLPDTILVKVDRAAMATSLETRAPFLDHELLELTLGLPARLVRNKRLLKRLAYQRIPRALLDRPKAGFGIPVNHWLRADLKEMLCDTVRRPVLQAVGIADVELVERLLREHASGERDHGSRLWTLLVLGLWYQSRSPAGRGATSAG